MSTYCAHSGSDARLGSQPGLPPALGGNFNAVRQGLESTLGSALSGQTGRGVSSSPLMSRSFVGNVVLFSRYDLITITNSPCRLCACDVGRLPALDRSLAPGPNPPTPPASLSRNHFLRPVAESPAHAFEMFDTAAFLTVLTPAGASAGPDIRAFHIYNTR